MTTRRFASLAHATARRRLSVVDEDLRSTPARGSLKLLIDLRSRYAPLYPQLLRHRGPEPWEGLLFLCPTELASGLTRSPGQPHNL
jgi:hypothetical protein